MLLRCQELIRSAQRGMQERMTTEELNIRLDLALEALLKLKPRRPKDRAIARRYIEEIEALLREAAY